MSENSVAGATPAEPDVSHVSAPEWADRREVEGWMGETVVNDYHDYKLGIFNGMVLRTVWADEPDDVAAAPTEVRVRWAREAKFPDHREEFEIMLDQIDGLIAYLEHAQDIVEGKRSPQIPDAWEPVDVEQDPPTLYDSAEIRRGDVVGHLTYYTDDDTVRAFVGTLAKEGDPVRFDEAVYLDEEQLHHARSVIDALLESFHQPRVLRRDPSVTPALAEVEN